MSLGLSQKLFVGSAVFSILGAMTSAANATSLSFDFEDGLPTDSLFLRTTQDDTVPFTPSIETIAGNNVLRLSDDLPGSQGGAINTSFVNPTEIFEDVTVSALLNPAGDTNDQLLLFARINLMNFDTYTAAIDFGSNRLSLSKVVNGEITPTPMAEAFGVLPDLSQPYFAELSVIDNQITGRFFDETGTHQLAELSVVDTDNPLAAGVTGVGVGVSDIFPNLDDPHNATIDNFTAMSAAPVASVPEPSSLLGLLVVGGLATKVSQRRTVTAKLR